MGENNDSFFENVLLKNINEDIPINVDHSDTPEKIFCFHKENMDNLKKRKVYQKDF